MNQTETVRKIVSISKEQLAALPAAECPGEVVLVDKEEYVDSALQALRESDIVGFDTETRPSFKKGLSYRVSLLQLSTRTTCFLIRLNHTGLTQPIIDFLEDENILKIGLSIHDDFRNLNKLAPIEPKGFIDLQQFVKDFMIADNSLSRIHGILFSQRISKNQRLTNWEAEELTHPQQTYAALDAFACIRIYDHLKQGNFHPLASPYYQEIIPEHPKEEEIAIEHPVQESEAKEKKTRKKAEPKKKAAPKKKAEAKKTGTKKPESKKKKETKKKTEPGKKSTPKKSTASKNKTEPNKMPDRASGAD